MRAVVLGVLCALSSIGPIFAQESPNELTLPELGCRNATAARMIGFSDDAAVCLADCYTHPGRSCYPTFPDPQTRDCLDRATARALGAVLPRCAGFDCPECLQSGGDCRSFDDNEIYQIKNFIGQGIGLVYCNDASSADGLSPAEMHCQDGMLAAGRRFGRGLAKCFATCQQRLRRGQILDPEACVSAHIDAPGFDAKTKACIERVRAQAIDRCEPRCVDRPECLSFTCSQFIPLLESQLFPHGDALFCVDQPPPVCGDGRVTQHESCDPTASPDGCPTDYLCSSCSYCQAPYCGDGRITTGEACDPGVTGSCGPNAGCAYDCQCHPNACSVATDISSAGGSFVGVTSGLGTSSGSCDFSSAPENVYRWTPSRSGVATVDACDPGNFFHAMVYVRTGSCSAGPEVACAQHSAGNACATNHGGLVQFPVTAGTTYYLFIDGWGGASGSYQLRVTQPSASASGAFVD